MSVVVLGCALAIATLLFAFFGASALRRHAATRHQGSGASSRAAGSDDGSSFVASSDSGANCDPGASDGGGCDGGGGGD